jgi:hypothetical protein
MAARFPLIAGLAATAALAGAGLVSAQTPAPKAPAATAPKAPATPAPKVVAPPVAPKAVTPTLTPPVTPPPGAAVEEPPAADEAPPSVVVAPPPVAAPPLQASEVAPAAPPKAQVVEKPAESTLKRARYDVAILQALDKVTAETLRFEAAVGQPVRYKTLVFTVKACEQSAEDEPQEDSIAYMTVDSQPRPAPGKPAPPPRQVFKGWMYASSPGLNPLQHPVYDAWLITCRAAAPPKVPAPTAR